MSFRSMVPHSSQTAKGREEETQGNRAIAGRTIICALAEAFRPKALTEHVCKVGVSRCLADNLLMTCAVKVPECGLRAFSPPVLFQVLVVRRGVTPH